MGFEELPYSGFKVIGLIVYQSNYFYKKKYNLWSSISLYIGIIIVVLYVNDLIVAAPKLFYLFLANDTNMFYRGQDIVDVINIINTEIGTIIDWLASNELSLNEKYEL